MSGWRRLRAIATPRLALLLGRGPRLEILGRVRLAGVVATIRSRSRLWRPRVRGGRSLWSVEAIKVLATALRWLRRAWVSVASTPSTRCWRVGARRLCCVAVVAIGPCGGL